MMDKMKELLADEAFVTKLLGSKDLDEAMACLKAAGVECSVEETAVLLQAIIARVNEQSMDMDAMDAVAGGAHETTILGDMGRQIGSMVLNTFSTLNNPQKGWLIASNLTEQVGHVINTVTNAVLGEKEPEWSRWYNPAIDGPDAGPQE